LEAAKLAADNAIRIHTIGIGSEPTGSVFNVPLGARRSELDEQTLRAISEATGGSYFRARNQQELASIYREIDRLEPTESDAEVFRPLRELFAWPLGGALGLSVMWALLRVYLDIRGSDIHE
jgi:Ca-activated chloride channel family protein